MIFRYVLNTESTLFGSGSCLAEAFPESVHRTSGFSVTCKAISHPELQDLSLIISLVNSGACTVPHLKKKP